MISKLQQNVVASNIYNETNSQVDTLFRQLVMNYHTETIGKPIRPVFTDLVTYDII